MSKRTGEEMTNPKVKKNWASDGVDPRSEYFTPRVKVFEFLEGQIRDKSKGAIPYLLLRAPYASGKTALMQASHKYFQDSFTVISVSMLCSSNCTNENFSAWLLEKANIGPERVLHSDTTITSFFALLKQGVFPKPVLLWFDEVQKIYDAPYAVSFLDHLKRIVSEHSSWNVEAIIFSGIYEDFVTGRSSPADITKRFGVDVLYFRPEEIKELIQDFNDNHLTFHIDENIVEPLHTATGGHPGFVVKCLASIEEHYIKEGVRFGIEDWVSWKTRHYKDALNSSRTAQQLADIYKNNENWRDIVKQLFRREPAKLDMTNELSMYFIKSGLICQAPGMLDSFNFGSPAVRLLLLEALLGPMLKERPTDKWFKNLIDILTVAVPLMDSQLIKSCLSTTVKNRKETWKESVWQNHFFAALYGIIPLDYCIDPEYSVKGGRVDYRITGEDFFGAVELLISESDQDKGTTESTENYILEHYYRFVKDPNGAFKLKYPELSKNFIVVNITHVKPKITIPGKLPLTYADLVFDDKLENITLYIDNYTIPLTMGDPILWDKQTNKSEPFEIRNYTDKFIEEESWQLNVDINGLKIRISINPKLKIQSLKNLVKSRKPDLVKDKFELYNENCELYPGDLIEQVLNNGALITVK